MPAAHVDEQHSFRTTAAIGLALVCLTLGAPFALVHLLDGDRLVGIGGLASTAVLCLHAWLMRLGRREAAVTLAFMPVLGVTFLAFLLYSYQLVGLLWCFPGILGLYCLLPERFAWLANAVLFLLIASIGGNVLTPDLWLRAMATVLALSLFAALLLRAVTGQFQRLQQRIITDPLTGLLNRNHLEVALERRLDSRRRARDTPVLLALDIDHFKRINDRFGHGIGDEVLRGVGACLRASVRSGDSAFRLGGEEFLVVLDGLDQRSALQRADALRIDLSTAISVPGRPVTVSIGVAMAHDDDSWSQWVSRADDALYRAKEEGRDRVVVALHRSPEDAAGAVASRSVSKARFGATA